MHQIKHSLTVGSQHETILSFHITVVAKQIYWFFKIFLFKCWCLDAEYLYLSIQATALGGNIPLTDLRLSCSVPSNMVVLELTLPGSSARGWWGQHCQRGRMSMKVAVPSPAILQDQLICGSFSFIVTVTKMIRLSFWLHPCHLLPMSLSRLFQGWSGASFYWRTELDFISFF